MRMSRIVAPMTAPRIRPVLDFRGAGAATVRAVGTLNFEGESEEATGMRLDEPIFKGALGFGAGSGTEARRSFTQTAQDDWPPTLNALPFSNSDPKRRVWHL
jgi:hypothetical protein